MHSSNQCEDSQANRLFDRRGSISKVDVVTIEAEDMLASRVFTGEVLDDEQFSTSCLSYVYDTTTWHALAC